MNLFPMQLDDSWITELKVVAQKGEGEFNRKINPLDPSFKVDVTTFPRPRKTEDWSCFLSVELEDPFIDDPSENSYPYIFKVEMFGFFTVDPEFDEGKKESFVSINGPSVLYSAIREVLTSITGRGPYEPIVLPTITFFKGPLAGMPTEEPPPVEVTEAKPVAAKARKAIKRPAASKAMKTLQASEEKIEL